MSSDAPLFLYGTLRRGEAAAHLLDGVVERRVPAQARGCRLPADRGHPRVRFATGADTIAGELVWLVPATRDATLARLDAYEGAPALFRRIAVRVTCGTAALDALAYEWAGDE